MSLRTVADDTSTPGVPVMWAEPTGSAVSMYSETTAFKMAALRGSSSSSGSPAGADSTGEGLGAGRVDRAVRFGTIRVLALDCSECYLGPIDRLLEPSLLMAPRPPVPGVPATPVGAAGDAPGPPWRPRPPPGPGAGPGARTGPTRRPRPRGRPAGRH